MTGAVIPDIPWATDEDLAEHDATLERADAAAAFARAVDTQAYQLRVGDAARAKVAAERAGTAPPFDAGLLEDFLARPAEPPHRVDGLIPSEGGTLIVAQRKAGKTSLLLNLARALIVGDDFLGRFPVRPIGGRVGFLNFEVSGAQITRWASEAGVHPDMLYLVNLRGRRNPLSLASDRTQLAAQLRAHDVESLMVDPFGRAYTGANQNDAGEVGAFLGDLDRFARGEAGVTDVIVAAHAGWNGERSRGSTALEDWADSIVTVTKDDNGVRYLRAEGRDVAVDEDQLDYDTGTRTLTLAGAGSRRVAAKTRQLEALLPVVLELLREAPSLSGNQLDAGIKAQISSGDLEAGHSKGDGAKAAQILERRGIVVSKQGAKGARLFSIPSTSPTSPNLPVGNSDDLPDLPLSGEVVQGSHNTRDLPNPGEVAPPGPPRSGPMVGGAA